MNDNIFVKTKRADVLHHTAHHSTDVARKPHVRQPAGSPVRPANDVSQVSQKERLYFEYCLENEPLVHDAAGLLIDGDAYPCTYVGATDLQTENHAHICWGRVGRSVVESASFVKTSPDIVEGTVVTTFDGAMKISAPYHLSRRKRYAVLFKPYQETSMRTVIFHRMNRSVDPAQAWKMTAISSCQGGTNNHTDMSISGLRLSVGGEAIDIHSAFRHSLIRNGNGTLTPRVKAAGEFGVEVNLRSKEMEQNMVVVRFMADEQTLARVQLGLRGDCRDGSAFCHEYAGKVRCGVTPGIRSVVVEAISRSSLYEPRARMASHFWVFPIVII